MADSVTYQIKTPGIIQRFVFCIKSFFGLADCTGFETADDLVINELSAGQIQFKVCSSGSKGPACGGHTDSGEFGPDFCLQAFFYFVRQSRNFFNIFNLSVDHSAFCMFFPLDSGDVHTVFLHNAHHADDASRSDIQGENHIVILDFDSIGLYTDFFGLYFRFSGLCSCHSVLLYCPKVQRSDPGTCCHSAFIIVLIDLLVNGF